ncbi:HTH-type transcriptional activator Btr [compost metagenome]
MDQTELDHEASYALDTFTNQFLAQYPVHCELRTLPLGQRLLHAHNGFEFYLCLQGSGSYIVGDRLYPLHAGTLTVIRPHVIHRPFSGKDQVFHRYVMSIDESYLERIQAACFTSDLRINGFLAETDGSSHYFLSASQLHRLELMLSELTYVLHTKTATYELAVLKCMSEFLLLLFSLYDEPDAQGAAKSEDEQIIGDVLSYLIAHYQEDVQINDIVRLFPISRSRLFDRFKEITGHTIKQFLTEYRLNKAKRLLAESALPITEVAHHAGFGDMSHFFNVFKKITGLTPKQYRLEAVKRKKGNPSLSGLPDLQG